MFIDHESICDQVSCNTVASYNDHCSKFVDCQRMLAPITPPGSRRCYFLPGVFCGVLACGGLGGAGLACGAFGWGTFACDALFSPATDPAFELFFDGPSLGGGGRFARAIFLRSNSAFCACNSCFLFHCSSLSCFSVTCHTTGFRKILFLRDCCA